MGEQRESGSSFNIFRAWPGQNIGGMQPWAYQPINCVCSGGGCVNRVPKKAYVYSQDVRGVNLSTPMLHGEQIIAATSSFLSFQALEASGMRNNTVVIVPT